MKWRAIIGLSTSGGLCHTHFRSSQPPTSIDTQLSSLAAIILYGAALALMARRLRHDQFKPAAIEWGAVALGLLLQLHATAVAIHQPTGPDLGLINAINVMLFVMTLFVSLAGTRLSVAVLLLPLLGLNMLALGWRLLTDPVADAVRPLDTGTLPHVIVSMVAGSILLLAFLQALLLRVVERHLKARTHSSWLRHVPPLETMESLLFAAVWAGLALFVLGIVSGFIYLDDMFAQRLVHHTILLSASAVGYAVLLIGRYNFGWRGATANTWVLIATTLLVLGYFGSKFVIEFLLGNPS